MSDADSIEQQSGLTVGDFTAADEPLRLFGQWLEDATRSEPSDPNAMALATVDSDGLPDLRMVLMKGFDERGLTFFTNYGSRKGGELDGNPRAALLFYWPEQGRQVRIEGPVERVVRDETVAYAHNRARGSQLSALASPQSRPVPGREWLEQRVAELEAEHAGELPVREDWGGFRVRPEAWEFWQHRSSRLHDRFRFEPQAGGGWTRQRLGP
jgi:pyridoxamine 5'-phosphate oxidase